MNQSDPARPIQYEQIKRKARDAGLTQHELDLLCQHEVNCAWENMSVMQATQVLAWLISVGPDRAKWKVNELAGQRGFL